MVIGKESRLEWQKFILKKITKRIPLVSSLACKKLRGTVSSLQQKKARQTKHQKLFLHLSENQSRHHRGNHWRQEGRNRESQFTGAKPREQDPLLEAALGEENVNRNQQIAGGSAWKSLRDRNSSGTRLKGTPKSYLQKSYQASTVKTGEKSPLFLSGREEKQPF